MALPTIYDEYLLGTYMQEAVKGVADALKLELTDFDEAVNDTLLAYGVTNIAQATDIAKLRALAKVEAWRTVVNRAANQIDYGQSNGVAVAGSYEKRSQLHDQAEKALERAVSDAERSGYLSDSGGFVIEVGKMTFSDAYAGVMSSE